MVRKTFASLAVLMSLGCPAYALPYDPVVLLAAEADGAAAEGENIVHEQEDGDAVENIASRYMLAQLSIVQGLTERLSSDLVAAVPDEVASSLQEVLADARALEAMAIDVGAGEYDELLDEMESDPAVRALYDKLDAVIADLEDKAYYNSPGLAEVVSLILNIISDL
ncbi:MAG: hypothetical protein IJB33_01650 [Akkermansia sp.]|nr:hypothetical protein [Akkermansia sp.]